MRRVGLVLWLAAMSLTMALGCTLTTGLDRLQGGGGAGGGAAGGDGGAGGSGGATMQSSSSATGGGGAGGTTGAGGGLGGYAGLVMSDGAVAYYRLDETTTPTAFDSAGTNDGTYVNSLTLDQPGLLASNACADFSLLGEVSVADVFDFAQTDAFTAEAWLYGLPQSEGFLVGKVMWDGSAYHGWMLVTHPSGPGVRFQRHGGKNLQAGDIVEDAWNHVVGTYDGVTLRLYLNGSEVAATPDNAPIDDHDVPLRIGRGENWTGFAGRIDEVAIYDRNLSGAEVLEHYEQGIKGL